MKLDQIFEEIENYIDSEIVKETSGLKEEIMMLSREIESKNSIISNLQSENEILLSKMTEDHTGDVWPIRVGNSMGTAFYATPERKVVVTAKHVTDNVDFTAMEKEFGPCWYLKRPERSGTFIDGEFVDIHFFGQADDVANFKKSCPSPYLAERNLGFNFNNIRRGISPYTAYSLSYPGGDLTGPPEKRYLHPMYRAERQGGLLAFYSTVDGKVPGIVVGGNSGGAVKSIETDRNIGVLVRAGSYSDFEVAVIQPFHNQMDIVKGVPDGR